MCIAFFISVNSKHIWWHYTDLSSRRIGGFNKETLSQLWTRRSVDQCWLGVDRHFAVTFTLCVRIRITIRITCCHISWIISYLNVGCLYLDYSNRIIENILVNECRNIWFVCMLKTSHTIGNALVPSSRDEFMYIWMSITWKSIGTRALPICTWRFLIIPHEFTLGQSIKMNESPEGFISRLIWSAITLGMILIEERVSHIALEKLCPLIVHGTTNFPGSLFFFSTTLCFTFSLIW